MVGLTLVDTTASLQLRERSVAGLTAVSSPVGKQVAATAATEVSLSAALSRSVTTVDPATLGAVAGTADAFARGDPEKRSSILGQVLGDLADTLSKGQGGYFVSYVTADGGGFAGTFTPDDFAALLGGKEGGSINGVTFGDAARAALGDLHRQQTAASLRQRAAAAADSTESDQQVALTLISGRRGSGHEGSKGPGTAAKPDAGGDGAEQIRLLIDKRPALDGVGAATVTIAYIPPSETSVARESVTETSRSVATLNLSA